jgi:hypothetical protein
MTKRHARQGDDAVTDKKWPVTLDEAVGVILVALPEEEAAKIAAMPESDLIQLHFGLGMWIRNNLGLWQGNDALMQAISEHEYGGVHPDDVSMLIITALWQRLREMAPKVH